MEFVNFCPFQWNFSDEFQRNLLRCIIRVWGWNERNQSVCIRIEDFEIPIWIELPTIINNEPIIWTEASVRAVASYLSSLDIKPFLRPLAIDLEYRQRLYNNQFYKDNDTGLYTSKEFPFLRVNFASQRAVTNFCMLMNNEHTIPFIGKIRLPIHCANKNLTPVMKLLAIQNIPSSNWILARCMKSMRHESNKMLEYVCSSQNLIAHPQADQMPIVHPKICSFDIETYSSDHTSFPDPENPNDKLLQIGCVFALKGQVQRKVCLTLGQPQAPASLPNNEEGHDFEIQCYKSEADLLMGWTNLIIQQDPDVLIGYNIFGFDIKYMEARARMCQIWDDFSQFGCIKGKNAEFISMKWESSARGVVDLQFLNAQGRLFIDLLPVIRASENLESYKLESVAAKHLKVNKDPIKPQDIFKSWYNKDWNKFYDVAKYCVQDTLVTYLLFEKLLIWLGLVESASTNKVPLFCMVSQGQQIKAFSQVFDFCYNHNTICNPPAKRTKEPYKGAIVTEPVAGLYKMILPFDFASLYPSIMIAHNIDFSRFVTDISIPDSACYCLNWEDHNGCEHDPEYKPSKPRYSKDGQLIVAKNKKIICGKYAYRFLKQDAGGKGVVPTIIENLLSARKKVRKVMEANEQRIHILEEEMKNDETLCKSHKEEIMRLKEVNQVLEKRQLAYKVNANSMYGMYGAENGYLPFFPGAESVTYIGRRSILAASKRIEDIHGGKVIYNDTDSAYCYFESMKDKSVQEIWDFAQGVVKDIETLFVKPMKLEFEGKIYVKFMIFTKKKYVAQPVDEHGKLKDKLYMRGIPLVRREYCANMKYIYEKCVKYILEHIDAITAVPKEQLKSTLLFQNITQSIHDNFLNVMTWQVPLKEFVIYKGLTKEQYANPQAHSAVADKIRARGTPVAVNSRIEYVLLAEPNNIFDDHKHQYEITEDLTYFKEFNSILRLDYLQYFNSQYVNYLDQMISTIFGVDNVVRFMVTGMNNNERRQYVQNRQQQNKHILGGCGSLLDKNRYIAELKQLFAPNIVFEKDHKLLMHSSAPVVCTANQLVDFDRIFKRKSIADWITIFLSTESQQTIKNVVAGTFEYDAYAYIINSLCTLSKRPANVNVAAEVAYNSWIVMFNYWKSYVPYVQDTRYKVPSIPLKDSEYDMIAFVGWNNLRDTDKQVFNKLAQMLFNFKS